MRVLLVPDKLDNWSAHSRCKALKKWVKDIDIDIINGVRNVTNVHAKGKDFDFVHLQYTGSLHDYYEVVMREPKKYILTAVNERSLLSGFELDLKKFNEMAYACAGGVSVSKKIALLYNFTYIPNGIDFGMFKDEHKACIGYVGTPRPNKNLHILREVCKDLDLFLLECLHGENQLPKEEMYLQYRKMNCLVHPSSTEGCSNPVLEALAMNVPVYMTKQGIWDELDGWVTFIEPTYESIHNAIKHFKSREMMLERFNIEHTAQLYKEFYERKYKEIYGKPVIS